jgi:hypothetical protein
MLLLSDLFSNEGYQWKSERTPSESLCSGGLATIAS